MSCRAFLSGLLVGAMVGLSGWFRYNGNATIVASPREVIAAGGGLRPQPLRSTLSGEQAMVEFDHGGSPDAPPKFVARASKPVPAAPTSMVQATSRAPQSSIVAAMGPTDSPTNGGLHASSASTAGSRYKSTGKLRALPEPVDVALPGMAEHVVARRSYKSELIMFTSDHQMIGWAGHWVNQMRQRGYEHWLILGDQESTCHTLQKNWRPMVERYAEEPLSCVWSSYPKSHPGWEQWRPRNKEPLHNVYILWASRWWVSWKLLKAGTNVLSLDVDAVLMTDIYELLRAPPLSHQDVILTKNADQSQSLNCGFVYFNRDAAKHQRVPRLPPSSSCPNAADGWQPSKVKGDFGGRVPAAEWVAKAMWERIALFLELDRKSLRVSPQREVLWEQDAWNDLAKSLELSRRVFPWAVGYGKDSDLWPRLGYQRQVVGGEQHQEKWVGWSKLRAGGLPPWEPPDEPPYAARFYRKDIRLPLLWLPLCAPRNVSSGANAPIVPAGTSEGIELGLVSEKPLLPGRLMVAPTWLASLANDPEPDWADSSPPPYSYLHLTNMWHCFPHMCWSKAGRLFWLRAHAYWDTRLDDLGITPRGAPFSPKTRALALPPGFFSAVAELTPPHNGDMPYVSARARWLAYRRMHALIHNLVTVAALIGRVPVIPKVPCAFVRAVQQRRASTPSDRSRLGVSHPSVVLTGPKDSASCHLAPGTWRPGGPDQCYHNRMMAQFDYDRFATQPYAVNATRAPLPTLKLPMDAFETEPPATGGSYESASLNLEALKRVCELAGSQADALVLELEGLLPIRDFLIDAPVGVSEFESEKLRLRSGRPRWLSLLQGRQLRSLRAVCPGAATLIEQRKACVGYFLAE